MTSTQYDVTGNVGSAPLGTAYLQSLPVLSSTYSDSLLLVSCLSKIHSPTAATTVSDVQLVDGTQVLAHARVSNSINKQIFETSIEVF